MRIKQVLSCLALVLVVLPVRAQPAAPEAPPPVPEAQSPATEAPPPAPEAPPPAPEAPPAPPAAVEAPAPSPTGTLTLVVSGLESDEGHALCALFRTKEAWLKDAAYRARASIAKGSATCVFEGVPPGTFAASAFHDENDSGDLDKNLLGIPSEGVCASMGATGRFGPPRFEDARFSTDGSDKRLTCVIP